MVTFRANIYGPLDKGMVVPYYNFAAGRFHTKKLCSRPFDWSWLLFKNKKKQKSVFETPFGRRKGNVRIRSIARWQARDRLPIRHNW